MPAASERSSSTGHGIIRQSGLPSAPEPPTRARKWVKGGAAFITFLFAVTGAITGIISFVRSEEVDVKVTARQMTFDHRAVDIGIVNESQRAVSIIGGTVSFDGETVGRVVRFVPGLGALDPRSTAERVASASRPPFSLTGGQAFAGTVEWAPPIESYRVDKLEQLDEYLGRTRSSDDRPNDRYRLVFDLEPGDDEDVPVRLTFENPGIGALRWGIAWAGTRCSSSTAIARYAVLPRTWTSRGRTSHRSRYGVGGSEPVLTATRPVVNSDRTSFALPARLRRGEYSWGIAVGGDTVAVGRFRSPCPRGPRASDRYHEVHSDDCDGDR